VFNPFRKKAGPKEPAKRFPPVPAWRPSIAQPLDRIAERMRYYTGGAHDFAVLRHGTCLVLPPGLSAAEAERAAAAVLARIFNAHPDMNPMPMDDGNVLVRYNHPAFNVVLADVAEEHRAEIDRRHLDALAEHEVLVTPLGPNRFDDFGKAALFGRCFMFMDAQDPRVVRVERAGA
jgi:hypothetical protein